MFVKAYGTLRHNIHIDCPKPISVNDGGHYHEKLNHGLIHPDAIYLKCGNLLPVSHLLL